MGFGINDFIKKILLYIYFKLNLLNKKVVFKGIPSLDKKVFFEGYNAIYPGAVVKSSRLGLGSYIGFNSKVVNTRIGRFCTIADNVRISLGRHPADTFVSIHPAFFSTNKQGGFSFVERTKFQEHITVDGSNYNVEIGNDVWIANNVLIMDGVKIGDGAIIASGAIVTKDVEPYAIVGGIPAKFIRWRFNKDQIGQLQQLKWWEKDIAWIQQKAPFFENIDIFLAKMQTAEPATI
jgi:acetyltransferase-like isoleucine patch superfamily enzyme